MKRFLSFLALAGAGVLAATAVSMAAGHAAGKACKRQHASTTCARTIVSAGKTCKGQGLIPGSDAFKACVKQQLGK